MQKVQTRGGSSQWFYGVAISAIFGSQGSICVYYCKGDEVYLTTLLWQKMDGKLALHRECCFPNCTKSWWKKLLS